jgi:hypothetical protein
MDIKGIGKPFIETVYPILTYPFMEMDVSAVFLSLLMSEISEPGLPPG